MEIINYKPNEYYMKTILAWIFVSLFWGGLGSIILFLIGSFAYLEPIGFSLSVLILIIFYGGIWGTAYLAGPARNEPISSEEFGISIGVPLDKNENID